MALGLKVEQSATSLGVQISKWEKQAGGVPESLRRGRSLADT